MNQTVKLAISCFILTSLSTGVPACQTQSPPPPAPHIDQNTSPKPDPCVGVWGAQPTVTYRVRFDMESVASDLVVPLPDAEGQLQLNGVLSLVDTGEDRCGNQRWVRFDTVEDLTWRVLGTTVETGRSWFTDYRTLVEFNDDGALVSLRFDDDAPRAWAQIMGQLLTLAYPVRLDPEHPQHVTTTRTSLGTNTLVWTRGECTNDGCVWNAVGDGTHGESASTAKVESRGEVRISTRRDAETMVSHTVYWRQEYLQSKQPVSGTVIHAQWDRLPPSTTTQGNGVGRERGPMVVWSELDDPARRSALEKRIAGLTEDQVLQMLAQYGAGGTMPHHEKWLWRAVGLLRLKPGITATLADQVTPEGLVWQGRGPALVLDLLANVGTEPAQKAMAQILDKPELQQRSDYGRLVQSALLVRYPRQPLIEAATRWTKTAPPGPAKRGAVNTLGALIGRWGQSGGEIPDQWLEWISETMPDGAGDEDRRAVVMALGNTRDIRALKWLQGNGVNDPSPTLRRTAVMALQQMPQSKADTLIPQLNQIATTDPVGAVATEAIRAMAAFPWNPRHCDQVDGLVKRAQEDETFALTMVDWVAGKNQQRQTPGAAPIETPKDHPCYQQFITRLTQAKLKGNAGHQLAELLRK